MLISNRLILTTVGLIVALAFAIKGLTTHDTLGGLPPNLFEEGFGWPKVFYSGYVRVDDDYYDNSWSDLHLEATQRRIHIIGLALDLLLLVTLLIGTVGTLQNVVDRIRPKTSIGLLIGLVTFAAVEIKLRWHYLLPPNEFETNDVELILAVYSDKIVYLAIVLSCFYVPSMILNVICRFFGRRKNTRNNGIHQSCVG